MPVNETGFSEDDKRLVENLQSYMTEANKIASKYSLIQRELTNFNVQIKELKMQMSKNTIDLINRITALENEVDDLKKQLNEK